MELPIIALAWLFGFASVDVWGSSPWLAGASVLALAPIGGRVTGRHGAVLVGVAAVTALVGGWWFERSLDQPDLRLTAHLGQTVTLEGVIDSEPDPGLTTVSYRLRVEHLTAGGASQPIDGAIIVRLNQYARYLPGDRLRVTGELEAPPEVLYEDFRYRDFLLSKGVTATMLFPRVEANGPPAQSLARWSTSLRLRLERSLQRSLPEPEASLAAGVAFGRDDGLSRELAEDFRRSGLAHLTAVSGSNVSLVAALAFLLFVPLVGRFWATVPAALLIFGYLGAAGFSASVVRASIMALIFLAGLRAGRPQSGLAGLALAAILMTAWEPLAATDVGFQLSLAATAGLMVLAPWVRFGVLWALARLRLETLVQDVVVSAFAFTTSATVATLPIVAYTFGRVSLIGLAANLVAEPIFAVAFALSGFTAFGGLLHDDLGWALGLLAYYPLRALVRLAEVSSSVPGAAAGTPGLDGSWLMAWAGGYLTVGWLSYRRFAPRIATVRPRRAVKLARRGVLTLAAGGSFAVVLTGTFLPMEGPGRLEMHVLDVGQGDAILLRTPGGRNILIDGGPSGVGLARELGRALPHWNRQLDLVVLTHPQEDHVAGLPAALDRYRVGAVLTSGAVNDTVAYREFSGRSAGARVVRGGDQFRLGDVRFEVLWPLRDNTGAASLNNRSLVLRVTYGATTFLLTGDIEAAAQAALFSTDSAALRADVLKVPHHGSKSSAPDFFAAVAPSLAVIPVGEGNRFGHPADETLEALAGVRLLRTDTDGRVTIRSDGRKITWETRR